MIIKDVPLTGIFVNDQEAALAFYTNKLGLQKVQDEPYGESGARWITVSPAEMRIRIVLKKAEKEHEKAMVGRSDGAPILTLGTDDIYAVYERLRERGVRFLGEPYRYPWGIGATAVGPGRQPHPTSARIGGTIEGDCRGLRHGPARRRELTGRTDHDRRWDMGNQSNDQHRRVESTEREVPVAMRNPDGLVRLGMLALPLASLLALAGPYSAFKSGSGGILATAITGPSSPRATSLACFSATCLPTVLIFGVVALYAYLANGGQRKSWRWAPWRRASSGLS